MSGELGELAEIVKDAVCRMGEEFDKPDDDWPPAAFVSNNRDFWQVPLTFDKEDWPGVLAKLAESSTAVAVVYSTWTLDLAELPESERAALEGGEIRISEHPRREEVVMVAVINRERTDTWTAPIVRDGRQPPRLGEWTWSEGIEGKFVDPIREGLRKVRSEELHGGELERAIERLRGDLG